jgi:hypothetical protein
MNCNVHVFCKKTFSIKFGFILETVFSFKSFNILYGQNSSLKGDIEVTQFNLLPMFLKNIALRGVSKVLFSQRITYLLNKELDVL